MEADYPTLAALLGKITLADLNNKYVSFRILNASADVYTNVYTHPYGGYPFVYTIKDGAVYGFDLDAGVLTQQKTPLVMLSTVQVAAHNADGTIKTDANGNPVLRTADSVKYSAFRGVSNPYDLSPNVQESPIVGVSGDSHAQAVGLIKGLVLFLQSLNFFAFEPNLITDIRLLDRLHDVTKAAPTTSTTTSTTTQKPTTTTSTTTSTTTQQQG